MNVLGIVSLVIGTTLLLFFLVYAESFLNSIPGDSPTKPGVSVTQLLSGVLLFVTPWTVARQASLSFTVQKYQFFGVQPYDPTVTSIHDYWNN